MLILALEEVDMTLPLTTGSHLRVRGQMVTLTLTRPCGEAIGHLVFPFVEEMCHVIDVETESAVAQA